MAFRFRWFFGFEYKLVVHLWVCNRKFRDTDFRQIKKEFWTEITELLDNHIPKKWSKGEDIFSDFVISRSDYAFDVSVFIKVKDKKSVAILKTCLPPDINCSLLEEE